MSRSRDHDANNLCRAFHKITLAKSVDYEYGEETLPNAVPSENMKSRGKSGISAMFARELCTPMRCQIGPLPCFLVTAQQSSPIDGRKYNRMVLALCGFTLH